MDLTVCIILIFVLASLDRYRELGIFEGWQKELDKIFPESKFKDWLFCKVKIQNIWVKGVRIPLHPIFWNGYHCFKNFSVLILLVYLSYIIGDWMFLIYGSFVWWITQVFVVRYIFGVKK